VTIRGNVISCDECGRQISMPMELEPGGKRSLDERVRDYAAQEGWTYTGQGHFCPEHAGGPTVSEEATPIKPEAELLGPMDQPETHQPDDEHSGMRALA
jgi:hypothetical protein